MIMNPREGILDNQVGGDDDVFRVLDFAFHDRAYGRVVNE